MKGQENSKKKIKSRKTRGGGGKGEKGKILKK